MSEIETARIRMQAVDKCFRGPLSRAESWYSSSAAPCADQIAGTEKHHQCFPERVVADPAGFSHAQRAGEGILARLLGIQIGSPVGCRARGGGDTGSKGQPSQPGWPFLCKSVAKSFENQVREMPARSLWIHSCSWRLDCILRAATAFPPRQRNPTA